MKYLIGILVLGASPAFATDYVAQQKFKDVIVEQKVVEFDDRYFYGIEGYYGVGQNIRQAQQIEATRQRDDEIRRLKIQIDVLTNILKTERSRNHAEVENGDDFRPIETPVQEEQPAEVPAEQRDPDAEYVSDKDLHGKVYRIFKDKCSACHGPDPDYSPELIGKDKLGFYLPSSDLSLADRAKIFDRVYGVGLEDRDLARMPKGDQPLTDEEVEVLRLYMLEKTQGE